MITVAFLLSSLSQAVPQQAAPPVTRVEIEPSDVAIEVGDTIRLAVAAYDSAGARARDIRVRWFQSGGQFEGTVDSTGLVTAGATGALRVSALVSRRSGGQPATGFAEVRILPRGVARIALEPDLSSLYAGQSLSLQATPYSIDGDRRYDPVEWDSDAPDVVGVTTSGRLTALKPGQVTVSARVGTVVERLPLRVVANPVASLELDPPTASVRTGDVVRFTFRARDATGKLLERVVPEWTLNPGSAIIDSDGSFVAETPGAYQVVASFAGRTAGAEVEATARDVERPAKLVGRHPIDGTAAEFWLHPDGRHGYLTTVGDRLYALDLSDPSAPRVTDSVVVDARHINDVMTTEDGTYGVMTREGASTRRNGIVILSFEDPAHPQAIAEFTETVTGGVHSTFVYRGYVYLTDDATGSMRVIDIRNPYAPRQVARWEVPRTPAGRMLHDIDVQDGLAYLSYWNDGLVILDVGNGIRGGSPESPQLVSQFKYDLNALYREVEAIGGPGFIRGTHTAWRHGRYVFVGDEVFAATPSPLTGPTMLGLGRPYGGLHVIDVSDILRPREVAYYEPQDGGAHNVWVAGDTLYLGDYQGGLRVVDISGELRGDLLRQGRQIAHVYTGDARGQTPNSPMAWGAIYRDGKIYVPDMNSGLWIVEVESKTESVP
ncbi:MAG: hypothetical protein HKM89_00225 [Gemmatimonadales bacterium]|nr:hypothetical protein [Gemmatimonadales bacterium]